MSASENKTRPTDVRVDDFLATLPVQRRDESRICIDLMRAATGHDPVMWGPSIVGFGSYHYRYATGREGDAPAAGFSPRKAQLVVYLADGVSRYEEQLAALGPHTTGQVCLYIKHLAKVDLAILEQVVAASYEAVMSQIDTPGAE